MMSEAEVLRSLAASVVVAMMAVLWLYTRLTMPAQTIPVRVRRRRDR